MHFERKLVSRVEFSFIKLSHCSYRLFQVVVLLLDDINCFLNFFDGFGLRYFESIRECLYLFVQSGDVWRKVCVFVREMTGYCL
jgi:hypothetical protein